MLYKINLKIGDYVTYNPQALGSTLAALRHYSPGPLGYREGAHYYIGDIYVTSLCHIIWKYVMTFDTSRLS